MYTSVVANKATISNVRYILVKYPNSEEIIVIIKAINPPLKKLIVAIAMSMIIKAIIC